MRIKPPRLREGDEIRIIAPASAPDMKNLSRSIARLKKSGYKVTLGRNIKKLMQMNQLAAPDTSRRDELMEAFLDDHVKAIFCARGGYGSIHILPLIDYDAIRDHPKIFVGYSDITALHLALNARASLITFHGPMPAADPDKFSKNDFKDFVDILKGETTHLNSDVERIVRYIIQGRAEGLSMGTNLSVFSSLIGTGYLPDSQGKILFAEDTGVTSGDIDRYLFTMKLAGILDKFEGFAFGEFKSYVDPEDPMPFVEDIIEMYMNSLKKVSIYGLPFGHGEDQMMIPLNAKVRISYEEPYVELLENVVD
ncbi:LD-carboxypeptidase [Thermoplasma sp.]|uniref:S66 peptidase family protein n=1 Tax=Thermoplasma sp. TaxID=1973142 RepID=UPI0012713C63|nr:LD-carboxypeptidase [Thermoplasma sp.]KAA8922117.1 MAG: LD-carboxypeptidase [Thermoplasma sp.]